MMRQLLIIAHTPSANTQQLANAVLRGATHPDISQVYSRCLTPLQTQPEDLLKSDAVILGTTENFGTMAGLIKDVFDRCYYPCLEKTQGLPCALYIRAGLDGQGTDQAIRRIVTGLKWKWVQPTLLLKGPWQAEFVTSAETLGQSMAAGLETGIF